MKIKRLMTAEEGMMGMRKYSCRLSIVWKGQQGWTTVGDCPKKPSVLPTGLQFLSARLPHLLLGLLVLWLMKSCWFLLWRSLGSVRLLSLRSIPLFSLTFQILLSTRLVGSLDAGDNEELLNIPLQRRGGRSDER